MLSKMCLADKCLTFFAAERIRTPTKALNSSFVVRQSFWWPLHLWACLAIFAFVLRILPDTTLATRKYQRNGRRNYPTYQCTQESTGRIQVYIYIQYNFLMYYYINSTVSLRRIEWDIWYLPTTPGKLIRIEGTQWCS